MTKNWNNPIQRKTASIFENLRRSRETEVTKPIVEGIKVSESKSLVPGSIYSFGGTDFLAVVENGVIREPEIESFVSGEFNESTWVTPENRLTFVRQDENTLVFNMKEGTETIEVCIANNEGREALINRLVQVAEANGREIMPEPKKGTEPNIDSNFPSGFIGDFEHGINDKGHGGFAGDGVGDYEKEPLTSKGEKGGQDVSSDELLGNKGTPEKFSSDTKSKKDKDAEMCDDPLTGSKEAGKYEKSDKQMGSHGSAKDFAREAVEVDKDKEDKEDDEEDKKDKKEMDEAMNKEAKGEEEEEDKDENEVEKEEDEDKKDKKNMKEAVDPEKEEEDEEEEEDEDKKDKKDKKDMKEAVGDPKKDKEEKEEEGDDEDDKKAKDEKEEVDEATARFFQEVGASVVRALISEMAKGGKKGLLTNESFIVEVAKRVARIEREGIKSVLPKTLESKMVYPAVAESMNFIDLVVFETNEGFYVVDRLSNDKIYHVEAEAVDSLIREGITSHAKSLSKVDEKVIFKSETQEYKFF